MKKTFSEAQSPRLKIAVDIRNKVEEGIYKADEKLPTEHVLTSIYGASRPTVRAALELLENEGIIFKNASRARIVQPGFSKQSGAKTLLQRTIVVVSNTDELSANHVEPGWQDQLVKGVKDTIASLGLHMLTLAPDSVEPSMVEEFSVNNIYGMIFLHPPNRGGKDLQLAKALMEQNIPVVFYSDSDKYSSFDTVFSDHENGSYQLTKYLIEQGYKSILRIFPQEITPKELPHWLEMRQAGFEKAMNEANLPVLPLFCFKASGKEPGTQEDFDFFAHAFAGYILKQFQEFPEIDAIITPSDGINFQTAAACRILGKEPGKDIAIVGYDNYWAGCGERRFEKYIPPVTVDKQNFLIGGALVNTIDGRRNDKTSEKVSHTLLKPKLVQVKE